MERWRLRKRDEGVHFLSDPDGYWVRYEDVKKLEKENRELRKKVFDKKPKRAYNNKN